MKAAAIAGCMENYCRLKKNLNQNILDYKDYTIFGGDDDAKLAEEVKKRIEESKKEMLAFLNSEVPDDCTAEHVLDIIS